MASNWLLPLWIGLGAGLGGLLRYAVAVALHGRAPWGLPLSTLTVNLAGSLVFGWLMARQGHTPLPLWTYQALTTGVLGGLTTYSTFNGELVRHLTAGEYGRAALYLAVTVSGGLVGGLLGWLAGRG